MSLLSYLKKKLLQRMSDEGFDVRDQTVYDNFLKGTTVEVIGNFAELFRQFNIEPHEPYPEQKSEQLSITYRDDGNAKYTSDKSKQGLLEACEYYNKCIAFALFGSENMAIAHANKSAVLLTMKKYKHCLKAIERCLAGNYPDKLRFKALLRRTKCLAMLRDPKVKDSHNETVQWIESYISPENRDECKRQLDDVYRDRADVEQTNVDRKLEELFKDYDYQIPNKQVPTLSSAVDLNYDEEFGRHLVASEDIRPGHIIAKEQPYCSTLDVDRAYSHCWGCMERLWDCVPCSDCPFAVYCSEKCRDRSRQTFHNAECSILPHIVNLHEHNEDFDHSYFRLLILAVRELGSVKKLMKEVQEVEKCTDPLKRGFSKDGIFCSSKYRSIYSLSFNTDENLKVDQVIIAVATMYAVATMSNLLGKRYNNWDDIRADHEITDFVGSVLLKNYKLVHTNSFSMKDFDWGGVENVQSKGTIICGSLSFLNHSCFANVSRIVEQGLNVLITTMPIKKGEQIFLSYVSPISDKAVRQYQLRTKYYFECKCVACKNNWPPMKDIQVSPEIKKFRDLRENFARVYGQAYELRLGKFDIERIPNMLKCVRSLLEDILEKVSMPCAEVLSLKEMVVLIYQTLYYNRSK